MEKRHRRKKGWFENQSDSDSSDSDSDSDSDDEEERKGIWDWIFRDQPEDEEDQSLGLFWWVNDDDPNADCPPRPPSECAGKNKKEFWTIMKQIILKRFQKSKFYHKWEPALLEIR